MPRELFAKFWNAVLGVQVANGQLRCLSLRLDTDSSNLVYTSLLCRKRILSRIEATEESLLSELRLAGMVLAYGPKSEESWAYRFVLFSAVQIFSCYIW